MKSYKEEYLKVLDVLIEVEHILEENGFDKGMYNSDLSDLYALTKKLLSIAYKYKKWNIDKNVMAYKGFKEIEYGIGIFRFKNITNYGDIDEEELLKISFPTGGYIFGDYYDVEYFEEFYKELHNVKPKYEDVLNHALYYSVDNGDEAYTYYKNTYDKFLKNYATRRKQMQIKELEEQISKLKEE